MQNTISDVRLQTGEAQKSTGISRRSALTGDVQMADPFMQIIMNLISQYADDTTQTEETLTTVGTGEAQGLEGLSRLLAGIGTENANGQNTQDEFVSLLGLLPTMSFSQTENAGELASLLQTEASGLQSTVLDGLGNTAYWQLFKDVVESVQESGKTPDVNAILRMLSQQEQGGDKDVLTALTEATTQNAQTIAELLASKLDGGEGQSTNVQQLIKELQGLSENGAAAVKAAHTGENADEAQPQSAKDMFSSAIEKAKELISKQPQKTQAEPDADAAVTQLQAKPVTPFELRFKTATETAQTPVAEQISTGIKQNLSLGKSEFTVKLNPESLGEITVKLVEDAGKTTLSITTASAQTAKLINSDMDALKAAVAPMNVQVNEAVTNTQASQQGGMQQFDMAGQFASQQQASQQFAAQQSFLGMTRGYRESGGEEAYMQELPAAAALGTVSTGRLDAYI